MKMISTTLRAVVAALLLSSSANATVLTFDDVSVSNSAGLPAAYGGLDWKNIAVANSASYYGMRVPGMGSSTGYVTGVVSGGNTVFNSAGLLASVSSEDPFDFEGALFTSAWSDRNILTARGYSNGALLFTKTLAINTRGPVWLDADFDGIDRLTLSTSNWQFAMDNFTFSTPFDAPPAPVPEPSGWLLLAAGFLGVGLRGKRRKV